VRPSGLDAAVAVSHASVSEFWQRRSAPVSPETPVVDA
jgi:hypothetical protein